jgi:hypothetical protein
MILRRIRQYHRRFTAPFCHIFIDFGSTVLHDKFVQTPVHLGEAKSNMVEYAKSGLPGCVGSSDCTHIYGGVSVQFEKQSSGQKEQ